ncbi:hypothetical protein AGMMS49940_17590 [Spirochaetia bacterium]|nr:hypothetical protein AGMMS49940_17590 [Spirochaetia bacterium]
MRNTLYAILTGILCLGVVLACEIPLTITVKGSPELYLNLGNPFEDGEILKGLLGDGFGTMMNTDQGDFYIYRPDPNPPVQTYLLSFKLIDVGIVPSTTEEFDQPAPITELKLHEIPEFFGGDVDFDTIPGYIYISGFDSNATMTIKWKEKDAPGVVRPLMSGNRPDGQPYQADSSGNPYIRTANHFITDYSDNIVLLPPDISGDNLWMTKIPGDPTLDLAPAFNAKSEVTLNIAIYGDLKSGEYGRVDLVILLPLKFTPSPTAPLPVNLDSVDYVKLDLEGMPGEGDDIFGRGDGGDSTSDLFDQLDYVKIDINDVQNTLVRGMFLGVLKEGNLNKVVTLNQGNPNPITIPADDLKPPFAMGIFVKDNVSNEPFAIMPTVDGEDPKFDFKLAVSAKTKLNIPVIK